MTANLKLECMWLCSMSADHQEKRERVKRISDERKSEEPGTLFHPQGN